MPEIPFNVTEALNQLRINLSFCGSQVKTVMVTSSVPNEGKSFIAMQLWKMMAEVGGLYRTRSTAIFGIRRCGISIILPVSMQKI